MIIIRYSICMVLDQGQIQEFQIEGAQKYYTHTSHITSAKREVPFCRDPKAAYGRWKL